MSDQFIVLERRLDADGNAYYVQMRVVDDAQRPNVKVHEARHCPAGHGLMRYSMQDDHLHCHCGTGSHFCASHIRSRDGQDARGSLGAR